MHQARTMKDDYGYVRACAHDLRDDCGDHDRNAHARSWSYLAIHGRDRNPVGGRPGLPDRRRGRDIDTYRNLPLPCHCVFVLSYLGPAYPGAHPVPDVARHDIRIEGAWRPSPQLFERYACRGYLA